MQEKKHKYLINNIFLFSISSILPKILSFIMIPLYTSKLTTSDYGIVDMINTTSQLVLPIFTLNIAESVLRYSVDNKNKEEIFKIGISITLKGSLMFLIILIILYKFKLIKLNIINYLFLFNIYFFNAIYNIFISYLRGINKIKLMVRGSLINSIFTLLSNIIFLVIFDMGVIGFLLSLIIGVIISVIYFIIKIDLKITDFVKVKISKIMIDKMKEYSKPLVLNSLAWWINTSADRYLVTILCGVSVNGIYSIAYKIPTILVIFQNVFSQAWTLSAIREFNNRSSNKFIINMYNNYNFTMILICSILIFFNIPIAKLLFSKDFFEAWRYSSPLLISVLFGALSGYIGSIFIAVKDTKIFSISTIIGAIVNIVFNILLIKNIGVIGASISTMISYVVIWLFRLISLKKYINLNLNLYRDITSYLILILEALFCGLKFYNYLIQFILIILIIILYRDNIKKIIEELKIANLKFKKY